MLKKLLKSTREYKKDTLATPLFAVLEVILEIMIPMLMAVIIDKGITGQNKSVLSSMGLILTVCVLFGILFGILSGSFAAKAAAGFASNLRQDMYYKIQGYSFANIDKFSTSSLVTRLTTDVTNVQNAYMMIIRVAVRAPVMLVFSLIAAFAINVKLSLAFLVAIPILGVGLSVIVAKSHGPFERVFKIYDRLNKVVQENVSGIRVVKSFVRESHEEEKFEQVSEKIYRTFIKAERIVAYNMPVMQFVIYGCMIFFCWFGARAIVLSHGTTMTTGELTSIIAYAMQILNCLMMLSMVFVMINMARASAERIVEILEEESTLKNPAKAIAKVENGEIIFSKVSFSYMDNKEKECLKEIDFKVPSGATLGIVGGTGSAKTSLVQLIPRLYDATEGEVLVGGKNVKAYDLFTLRNEVAMVLQKNELFSGTITENLKWGNEKATEKEVKDACRLAQAHSFIEQFPDGYETYIEQGGTNVSGGQKQRLCIARALLKQPKILILDDSTSAVDTATDAMIRKAFREQIPDTTKIIIAQRISSVEDADMIAVMDGGRLNGLGTHEELLESNQIYKEMYTSQVKGGETDEENK